MLVGHIHSEKKKEPHKVRLDDTAKFVFYNRRRSRSPRALDNSFCRHHEVIYRAHCH